MSKEIVVIAIIAVALLSALVLAGENESEQSRLEEVHHADTVTNTLKNIWRTFDMLYPLDDESDQRMKNYAVNLSVWESSGLQGRLIEDGQGNEPQCGFRLGKYGFGYNGCEVIAAYNFLVLNGENPSLPEIAFEFETNALAVKGGALGSNPKKISGFLKSRGLDCIQLESAEECDKELKDGKSLIFSFWTGKPYLSSIHTVAITSDGYVLNRTNHIEGKSKLALASELLKYDGCFITAYCLK